MVRRPCRLTLPVSKESGYGVSNNIEKGKIEMQYNYRGKIINIDEAILAEYKEKRGRNINAVDIDQYISNESKAENDIEKIVSNFSEQEISEIVNYYLDFENRLWS